MIAKFAVGQRVKCKNFGNTTGEWTMNDNYGGAGWRKDFEFTIGGTSNGRRNVVGMETVYWPIGKRSGGIFEKFLEACNEDWDSEEN